MRLGGPNASVIAIQNEGDAACLLALAAASALGITARAPTEADAPLLLTLACLVADRVLEEERTMTKTTSRLASIAAPPCPTLVPEVCGTQFANLLAS